MSVLRELNVPVFYAEGIPRGVTRQSYRLEVEGKVEGGHRTFTFADIEAMPFTTVNARLTSVSGWSVRADWQGVRFGDFLDRVRPEPAASHALFQSFGAYTTCVPLEQLRYEKVLLCYRVAPAGSGEDGEYLEIEYGGPVRMFLPQLWGYKSISGLARMAFVDRYVPGFWESRGYTDDAEIEPGTTLDINTRTRRRIEGGEVTEF